jgi:hypothetical protein
VAKKELSPEELLELKKIYDETARRKRIWEKMDEAARDAVKAVEKDGKRKGVKKSEWFGYATDPTGTSVGYTTSKPSDMKYFRVLDSGIDDTCMNGDAVYGGYPDLTDADPAEFRDAAIHLLGICLRLCIEDRENEKQ